MKKMFFELLDLKNRARSNFHFLIRRAGCLISTRRVIRCQRKLEKWGRRHIDKAKDLKSKINLGSCVQFLIWLHFRIELDVKHMLAGRIFPSIDFIGVETPDEGRRPEFKKSEKVKKIWKIDLIIFFRFTSSKNVFFIIFHRNFNDCSDS